MRPGFAPLLFVLVSASGCAWVSLGYNALTYPTTAGGEAGNVVISGSLAYVTLAGRGLEIIDIASGKTVGALPPAQNTDSVDDLAVADGLLFVLDARIPGNLSVYSLKEPAFPVPAAGPIEVPVGPFSGVSAGGGRVIVSGGTSLLTMRTYDGAGRLAEGAATLDLGRGQPDVFLAAAGDRAFVSTHYYGPEFGLVALKLEPAGAGFAQLGKVDLPGAGFTAGGAKPANFPMDCALQGDTLLLAHSRGLAFIKLSGAAPPRLMSVLDLGLKAVNVDARDGIAAVVGSAPKPALVLIDTHDPDSPAVLRTIPLPSASRPTGVAIGPTHIVVAAQKNGTLIFKR